MVLERRQRARLWHVSNDAWLVDFFSEVPFIESVVAAAFEPVMRNANGTVLINNGAHTLNLADNATVSYPVGTKLRFNNQNAAAITVTDDAAVTWATGSQSLVVAGIAANAVAEILKTGTDEWFVIRNEALPS